MNASQPSRLTLRKVRDLGRTLDEYPASTTLPHGKRCSQQSTWRSLASNSTLRKVAGWSWSRGIEGTVTLPPSSLTLRKTVWPWQSGTCARCVCYLTGSKMECTQIPADYQCIPNVHSCILWWPWNTKHIVIPPQPLSYTDLHIRHRPWHTTIMFPMVSKVTELVPPKKKKE